MKKGHLGYKENLGLNYNPHTHTHNHTLGMLNNTVGYSLASTVSTVCPGSSDPSEKKHLIYLHQKMRFTPFINYYNTLG